MKAEYKKDLKRNYLIITGDEINSTEDYCMKMLEYQVIDGILPVERRRFNESILFYYDISSRQSMAALLDKASLTKYKISQLCNGIINTLERAYEYLLPEEDFILLPEYIFLEVVSNEPTLCFLPGYGKPVKEQMSSLLEYLMNKVDYNDREAVLLVYRLYAVSREEGYTFEHLMKELSESVHTGEESQVADKYRTGDQKSIREPMEPQELVPGRIITQNPIGNKAGKKKAVPETEPKYKSSFKGNYESDEKTDYESDEKSEYKSNDKIKYRLEYKSEYSQDNELEANLECISLKKKKIKQNREYLNHNSEDGIMQNRLPMMMEKLEGEVEIACYPLKTYLYTVACGLIGLFLLVLCFVMKLIYNTYGDQIDYTKLAALLLIVFCVEGYLMKIIWDKKNKITRMITRNEYVDPGQYINNTLSETNNFLKTNRRPHEEVIIDTRQQNPVRQEVSNNRAFGMGQNTSPEGEKEEDNPTCLLNNPDREWNGSPKMNATAECVLQAIDEVNYQSIPIGEFPFFIGKLKKNVDYCLENDVVSRYHAKLLKEDNRYFIMDMNSTNGTFVNGEALKTYEKKEIRQGDEISFANIRYKLMFS